MYESLLNPPGSLFEQFDRLRRDFDDLLGLPAQRSSIRAVAPGTWPAVNVGRTSTSVEIYAFAPGLDASKIDVTIDRGVLRIAGERSPAAGNGDAPRNVYTRERGQGAFSRAIALPDDVDPARVHATYRDGVLHLSIARHEAAQPKRITVQ